MKKYLLIILLPFVLVVIGCNSNLNNINESITVDFSDNENVVLGRSSSDSLSKLHVAVAAMISPKETFVFYEELLKYISEKTNTEIVFRQRKTYDEVNQMLEKNEVDLAFICSGAYATGKEQSKMEILVIPESNGKKYYQAYIVVHVNSDFNHLEDLKDKKFAFTDPISHSGKLYIEKRLAELGHSSNFFSKTIFSNAHDVSMQLVSKQIVDGASIKSSVYDYLEKFHPERISNLRIIEKSEHYGMPPVVVPEGMDLEKKEQLGNMLLSMHQDPKGKEILDKLLIDRFILGDDQDYNSIREIITMSHP